MAEIEVLPEFSQNGDKRNTGLVELNGFPAALKPARQWFNFLFNKITLKINEVIQGLNSEVTARSEADAALQKNIETEAKTRLDADNDEQDARIAGDEHERDERIAGDDALSERVGALEGSISPRLVPSGTTVLWCAPVIPEGYLELAGQAISRTEHSALFDLFGITYGAGDGATTFNLPNTRGEFIRGWDRGRGVDVGRELGSYQEDTIQNITGSLKADVTSDGNTQFIDNLEADGVFEVIPGNKAYTGDNSGGTGQAWGARFDASLAVRTSTETRGRNLALIYIIKT